MHALFARFLLFVVLLSLLPAPASLAQPRPQAAAQPYRWSGSVLANWSWTLGPEQVVFSTRGDCFSPTVIWRTPLSGGTVRSLLSNRPTGECDAYDIRSNIASDGTHLFWMDATGLVRMPIGGGELPVLMNPNYRDDAGYHTVALLDDKVYVGSGRTLWRSSKVFLDGGETITTTAATIQDLTSDGTYYFFRSAGDLYAATATSSPGLLRTNVNRYYAEGLRPPLGASPARRYLYYARPGTTTTPATLHRLEIFTGDDALVYTSNAPAGTVVQLEAIATDRAAFNPRLFFWEQIIDNCGQFVCDSNLTLYRSNLAGGSRQALYSQGSTSALPVDGLSYSIGNLYYRYNDSIYMIDAAADALVATNLVATKIEITQGIQRADGSLPLIAGKRTFVRLLVRSEGSSTSTVKARLYGEGGGITPRTLAPINLGEGGVTVSIAPDPLSLKQSFLFELPPDWTRANGLTLTAIVNPYDVPRESNRNDNALSLGPLNFQQSGTLSPLIVRYNYNLSGKTYRTSQQQVEAVGELTRALFPLDGAPGNAVLGNDRPGFHPDVLELSDNGIAARITAPSEPSTSPNYRLCSHLIDLRFNPATFGFETVDRRNLCASEYVNGSLARLKFLGAIPLGRFAYGLVPAQTITNTVRGLAHPALGVASGNAGNPFTAVHEIGHILNRDHPFRGSVDDTNACGNSRADGGYDYDYPYVNSRIGATETSVIGLDYLGYYANPPIIGKISLLPGTTTFDIMGYCAPRGLNWISDYTYNCLLKAFANLPPGSECDGIASFPLSLLPPARGRGGLSTTPAQASEGDWLSVIGSIAPDGKQGILHYVDRMQQLAIPSPIGSGSFRLHLLGAGGTLLADYAFEPDGGHHGNTRPFALVVPFVAGTREVRVVAAGQAQQNSASPFFCTVGTNQAGGIQQIASQPISANPPTLGAVALRNPADPLTTTATLAWQGADSDGNSLRYDILFSSDGGATFKPLLNNLAVTEATLDLSQVGAPFGAQVLFRVVANDGAQTTMADSPPYTLAARAPQPLILTPTTGSSSQYGQLITFRGTASDAQDGAITGGNLIWSLNGEQLGNGETIGLDELPVGTHTIILGAYNSFGAYGETSITISVGDSLSATPPTLSVAPESLNAVAAPDGSAQNFSIAIENLGDGVLEWAASENAPWLSLNATSGSTPGNLVATLDPAGLSAGEIYTASITFSATPPGGSAQTITLPLTFAVRSSDLVPPPPTPAAGNRVYLPMLIRE
jgi:hypothetical protein